jgi:hypothetical protein
MAAVRLFMADQLLNFNMDLPTLPHTVIKD